MSTNGGTAHAHARQRAAGGHARADKEGLARTLLDLCAQGAVLVSTWFLFSPRIRGVSPCGHAAHASRPVTRGVEREEPTVTPPRTGAAHPSPLRHGALQAPRGVPRTSPSRYASA
jgi:hypothetical protein